MKHDTPRTGLFTASKHDENWRSGGAFFDTRDEAMDFGRQEFGESFHTGEVRDLTDDDVADAILRDESDANEHLLVQDEWSWREDDVIHANKEHWGELRALVVDWVKRHKARVPCWSVNEIQRHIGGGAS